MEDGAPPPGLGSVVLDSLRQPFRSFRASRREALPAKQAPVVVGQGEAILVFPMFGGGPESTARLRAALDRQGFASHDWGYGTDTGPRSRDLRQRLRRLEELVIDIFEAERQPVTLLGWGLSGIYARELAKRATPLVRQVITLGTPINPGAGDCPMLQPLEQAPGRLNPEVALQLRQRPPVPCTAIYSLADRAVPWQMCVMPESAQAENIAVAAAGHRDLADHPKGREIIVDRLAQPPLQWRRFAQR